MTVKRKLLFLIFLVSAVSVLFSALINSYLLVNNVNTRFNESYAEVMNYVVELDKLDLDILGGALLTGEQSDFKYYFAFSDNGDSYTWLTQPSSFTDTAFKFSDFNFSQGRYKSNVITLKSGGFLFILGDKGSFFSELKLIFIGSFMFCVLLVLFLFLLSTFYTRRLFKPLTYFFNNSNPDSILSTTRDKNNDFQAIVNSYKNLLAKSEDALMAEKLANDHLLKFVAEASHELRTPLTVILGYAELLKGDVHGEAGDWTESIHSESLRMSKLVNNLLDTIETGISNNENKVLFSIKTYINKRCSDLMTIQPKRNVSINLTDCFCIGQEGLFVKTVDNIISNVVKYTNEDSSLFISSTCHDGVVSITFLDGGGLKLQSGNHLNIGSSGLGKGIIEESVTSLGGIVRFSDNDIGGFTVAVSLPCTKGH